MRRLFYCGEWMESHALHIHLLAAPDFLGYGSAPEMARDHPEAVKRGLRLQALGNEIIRLLGARSVHPVGAKVGGFHRAPSVHEVGILLARLREALPDAEAMLAWSAALPPPDDDQDFVSVALRHPDEYPMNEGRLVSSEGLDVDISEFDEHFEEMHVPHSTALHARLHGRPYLVGPLARLNLDQDRLPQRVRELLDRTGIRFPSRNMFHSIVARAAETYYALVEAIRLLENYRVPASPYISVTTRSGVGFGCTEAPRGILWHRYEVDAEGLVINARIVPPTSQNQARMEEDLRFSLQSFGLDRSQQELRLRSETVIRNYDPCISCSTHFLDLRVHRP
jgi:sulfhydrogenase subunit alpha